MAKIDLLDQKWIDLVFEGKNEAYGAYQIRRDTKQRNLMAMIALIIGLAAIVGIFLLVNVAQNVFSASSEHETTVELEAVQEEVEEEPEEEEIIYEPEELELLVEEEQVMSSEKFTAYEMDDEVKPEEVTKTQDEMAQSTVAVGAFNVEGQEEAEHVLKVNEKIVDEVPEVVEDTHVFEVVEQMPQFPGGDAALMQYLSSHIHYPAVAEENGIQGRVVCTFVVEKNGSITDVRVVRSVDAALDREAQRVIKSMPAWIPGKQNGAPVRVKYTVPVTFRLQ